MELLNLLSDACKHLSLVEKGELVSALIAYNSGERYTVTSPVAEYALANIIDALDKKKVAREKAAVIHRECGKRGGRPKKNSEDEKPKITKNNQNGFSEEKTKQNQNGFSQELIINELKNPETKNNQNGFAWDSKGEKEESAYSLVIAKEEKEEKETPTYVGVKKKEKTGAVFKIPTVEEVAQECAEKKYSEIDPIYFVAHYSSIGWVVGKNRTPMKSWKQTLITWHQKYLKEQQTQNNCTNGCRNQANNIGRDLSDRKREYKGSF